MPSFEHEALLQLFRNRPSLAPQLLRTACGVDVSEAPATTIEGNLTQLSSIEYRADLVIAVGSGNRVVVEVQLGRDEAKRWSWPLYVAALRAKERCAVHLLVLTTRPEIADWARRPIELGHHGFCLVPWVIGPEVVPRISDPEIARESPELAVLSTVSHGHAPEGGAMALAALQAASTLDPDRATTYHELIMRALGPAARKALEELMATGKYEFETDLGRKYFQLGCSAGEDKGRKEGLERGVVQGRIEAASRALLTILARRGLALSEQQRTLIESCTDAPTVELWVERSFDVASVDELFG